MKAVVVAVGEDKDKHSPALLDYKKAADHQSWELENKRVEEDSCSCLVQTEDNFDEKPMMMMMMMMAALASSLL